MEKLYSHIKKNFLNAQEHKGLHGYLRVKTRTAALLKFCTKTPPFAFCLHTLADVNENMHLSSKCAYIQTSCPVCVGLLHAHAAFFYNKSETIT